MSTINIIKKLKLFSVAASVSIGAIHTSLAAQESLDDWILKQRDFSASALLRNISPSGAMPGAAASSLSHLDPNYDNNWVRDSGVAMNAILSLYESDKDPSHHALYRDTLMKFVDFSRHIQKTAVSEGTGLGEPIFTMQGEPNKDSWARSRDDGPAIRAITLTHFAFALLQDGEYDFVQKQLYDGKLPTDSVIKMDLEYLSHTNEASYGPWEDGLRGDHFYTQFLKRKALLNGSLLALRMGDMDAARLYVRQAKALEAALKLHWDSKKRQLNSGIDERGNLLGSRSGLDSSVVIASLGGYELNPLRDEDLFAPNSEEMLATAAKLEESFAKLYPINDLTRGIPGIAMGRYPEDLYDGYHIDSKGNPWSSITSAFGMFYYELIREYLDAGKIAITHTNLNFFNRLPLSYGETVQVGELITRDDARFNKIIEALRMKGDSFIERVKYHANPDGTLSEEINRETGFQQGAPNLSTAYASFVLSTGLRSKILERLAR